MVFLFCSGPIATGLISQLGCRVVVMSATVITASTYMILAFSSSIELMLGLYSVIGGLSTGCAYIATLIIIVEYFDKKRGMAIALAFLGIGVNYTLVFPLLIKFILNMSDWRLAMSISACIILQLSVCGALMRPLNPAGSVANSTHHVELRSLSQADANKNEVDELKGSFRYERQDNKMKLYQRNAFLRATFTALKSIFDFRLLIQNTGFLFIALSNLCFFVCYFSPFLYINMVAQWKDISKERVSLMIIIISKTGF
jgi:predicted MFS family arabinose efflux permease